MLPAKSTTPVGDLVPDSRGVQEGGLPPFAGLRAARGRRGNLLLMAIFMAVFLFFLAVALVMTNRQDILLSLSVDHRLRAETAARSAANLALQTMRTDAAWEDHIASKSGQMNSGAAWTVKVAALSNLDTRQPPMVEIRARGSSGFVSADYRIVAEEFRICDEMARKNVKPHLFAIANVTGPPTTLMMMGPSFRWSSLGPLGEIMVLDTMAGSGGLLYMNDTEGPEPPEIKDFIPNLVGGFYVNSGFQPTGNTMQKGRAANALELLGQTLRWKRLPDPNDYIGKLEQATIDGKPNGAPNMVTFNLGGGQTQTVDTSLYKGPMIEWYTIDGLRQVCEGDFMYCFATHYYYQGAIFQNKPVQQGSTLINTGTSKPSRFIHDDALLCWDNAAGRWQVTSDCLKVIDNVTMPYIAPGPRPTRSVLGISNQNLYSLNNNQIDPFIIKALTNRWEQETRNDDKYPTLLAYRGAALFAENGPSIDPVPRYRGLLRPADEYAHTYREVRGDFYDSKGGGFKEKVVVPEQQIDINYNIKHNNMAVYGNEIFALGYLRSRFNTLLAPSDMMPMPTWPGALSSQVLLHFDGKHWQIWPGGLYQATWDPLYRPNNEFLPVLTNDGYLKQIQLGPLAICGYASPAPLMRRYVPVSAGFDR